MLLRLRWFILGVLSAVGGGAYLLARLRRLRARLTPANLLRTALTGAADVLDKASRAIAPKGAEDRPG